MTSILVYERHIEDVFDTIRSRFGDKDVRLILLQPAKFALEYNRRLVDLSLPLRFSGIPANAVVDLVPAVVERGSNALVNVALQLPSGERLTASHPASTMLGDILVQHATSGALPGLSCDASALPASNFDGCSIVYMRTSVAGAALASTTLASLGLTRGSVALRCGYPTAAGASAALASSPRASPTSTSTPEESPVPAVTQTGVCSEEDSSRSAMDVDESMPSEASERAVVDPATVPANQPAPDSAGDRAFAESDVTMDGAKQEAVGQHPAGTGAAAARASVGSADSETSPSAKRRRFEGEEPGPAPAPSTAAAGPSARDARLQRLRGATAEARAALDRLRASAWDEDAAGALRLLLRYLDGALSRPGDTAVRTIRLANAAFQRGLGRFPGGVDVLVAAGFSEAFSPLGEACLTLYTPLSHPAAEAGLASAGGMDADDRVAAEVEDPDVVLAVRGAVAGELMGMGEADVPPAPRVDRQAAAARQAAVQAAAAAFDPFKPMVMRVGETAEAPRTLPASLAVNGAGPSASSSVSPFSAAAASSESSARVPKSPSGSLDAAVRATVALLPTDDAAALLRLVPAITAPSPLSPTMLALLSDTERKATMLRWRRAALLASKAPRHRSTRIVIFDAEAAARVNPARFGELDTAGVGMVDGEYTKHYI